MCISIINLEWRGFSEDAKQGGMSNEELLIVKEPHDDALPASSSIDDEESRFTGSKGNHKKKWD